MNLTEFMKKADKLAMGMPAEKLAAFLHDYVRSVPEHKREDFLKRLSAFAERKVDNDYVRQQEKYNKEQTIRKIGEITEQLEQINSGELTLTELYNEEYDDWYNSSEEEVYYEDPEGIGEIVREGCDLVHTCADNEWYEEGAELAELLMVLEAETDGEYVGDTCSLQELAENNILTLDYEKFVTEALLVVYWGTKPEERPEALYHMLLHASCEGVSLETLMQKSTRELDRFSEFLASWIDYLGRQDGRPSEKYLREAIALTDDPEILPDAARKYTDLHPGLYVQVLERCRAAGQSREGWNYGREAMERIRPEFTVRSRAALLAASFALELGERDAAQECWLEAFRSDSSVTNYLRLILECGDRKKYQSAAETIYTNVYTRAGQSGNGFGNPETNKKNSIDHKTYCTLLFFDGKFHRMLAEGMHEKDALGWSGTFMKEGMALWLLYLYADETLRPGIMVMCRRSVGAARFSAEEYLRGTARSSAMADEAFFWECFRKWRENIVLPEEEIGAILEKLENWVRLRTEGIVGGGRRNYYGECAAWIAALGEVKESRGEPMGKAKLMEAYRGEYPRHRAFHQELRDFGMI
ncbi:MAG TPA: hypothetical protein DF613_02555 [Lachnospiraceae bacterium]|nr:hypothetical protein [Lachnospiraceae bacterium]